MRSRQNVSSRLPRSVAVGLQQGEAASLFSRLSFFIILVINNGIQA
jgi:hypothetical protein